MNQAIDLINEMMHDLDIISCDFSKDGELKRTYDAMKGILKEARDKISSLPSDTQWIDVKSGNPKGFCNYIVTNGKSSFEAWYSDVDNIFKHIDDSGGCKGITHYMEFPNPPKR